MKRPTPTTLSRKEFLKSFACLLAYSAPAVAVLETVACTAGTSSTGSNCSYSGSGDSISESCDSESISLPTADAGTG